MTRERASSRQASERAHDLAKSVPPKRRRREGGLLDSSIHPKPTTEDLNTMKNELGLLWIPVGFLLMIGAVAALFLTVMPS